MSEVLRCSRKLQPNFCGQRRIGLGAAQKTNQLRRAVADSFGAMADIIGEIAAQTARSEMFLPAQTSCAVDVLGGLGLNVISACCKRDCEGHIKLTAKAAELPENPVLRKAADTLSQELGAALALPAHTRHRGRSRADLRRKTALLL